MEKEMAMVIADPDLSLSLESGGVIIVTRKVTLGVIVQRGKIRNDKRKNLKMEMQMWLLIVMIMKMF